MKRLIPLFILLLSTVNITAQSAQMLDKGKSGIGCNFSLANENGVRQSGFSLGYSYKGIADISVTYLMSFMDYSRIGALRNSTTGTFNGLELNYWPIRKEFKGGGYLKTGITAGVGEGKFDDLTFWDNGSHHYYTVTSNRLYYGGVEMLMNVTPIKHFVLQPLVAVTYTFGTEWYKKQYSLGNQKYDDLILLGGVMVGYKTNMGATIGVGFISNLYSFDGTNVFVKGLEISLPL